MDFLELKRETRESLAVVAAVVLLHGFFICYLSLTGLSVRAAPSASKRLVANTIHLAPVVAAGASNDRAAKKAETPSGGKTKVEDAKPVEVKASPKPAPSPSLESIPKPAVKQTSKIPPPKAVATKKTPEKAIPPKIESAADAKKKELIANVQKSIGKIEPRQVTIVEVKQAVLPSLALDMLPDSVDSSYSSPFEAGYREEISLRLRLFLRLPEYGEVTVKLTVDRKGNIIQLDIVSAQSNKNKKYVESAASGLVFPGFGDQFPGEQQHTFTIVLRNEV